MNILLLVMLGLASIMGLLFFALGASDLLDYWLHTEQYFFGTEVAGFVYSSKQSFMIFNALKMLVGGAIGVFAGWKIHNLLG